VGVIGVLLNFFVVAQQKIPTLNDLPAHLNVSPCDSVVNRPCIALVLGGGGARGGAHLGVIKELERQHIPIDMIIGTSIGAFIGGLYASGKTPEQISEILTKLDWGAGFHDRVYRDEMPTRRKQQYDNFPIRTNLGLDLEGVKLPSGLFLGQAMAELVADAYGVQPDFGHFDQMNIPFRAIATDLTNRDVVVLEHGSLVAAVQASMSIPGVVRPVKLNGKLLVDGGVANNLPIDIAKALGADHVIAVDIDLPAKSEAELNSAFAITEQLTGFLVRQGVAHQITLLEKGDVLIQPRANNISTLAFERIMESVAIGEQAAIAQNTQLRQLTLQQNWYEQWVSLHRGMKIPSLLINKIKLNNKSRLADEVVLARLGVKPGQVYLTEQINKGIRQVYGLDTFERVSHQLQVNEQQQTELLIDAEEKSWGPNYINFRFLLEDDFNSDKHVQLATAFTMTNLSELGAEWRNELAVGTDKLFSTELYWPIISASTFVSSELANHSETINLQDQQGLSLGNFIRTENLANINLGWNISDKWLISAGWTDKRGKYQLPASLSVIYDGKELHFTRQGPQLNILWDSLNDNNFPTRGGQFKANWQWLSDNFLDTRSSSENRSLSAVIAKHWHQHVFKAHWRFDSYQSEGGDIALEQYALGGLFNLSGYPKNFLFGPQVRLSTLTYMYKLHENKFSIFNSPLYLGSSLERGKVKNNFWQQADQPDEWIWAGSVFIGWDSIIGPIYFAYGQAESVYIDKARQFYLSIGQPY
jgi:NTE family protein